MERSGTGRPLTLIIGGGIGGMTASIALRRHGFSTLVFERQPAFSALGVGVILCSNALKSFQALGADVGDAVIEGGFKIERDFIHREYASPFGSLTGPPATYGAETIEEQFGAPQVAIRRSQLLEILVYAHGPEGLNPETDCVGFQLKRNKVAAVLSDGRCVEGDVLIGADGLGSRIRKLLHGNANPDYTGWGSLRGLTQGFELPDRLTGGMAVSADGTSIIAVPVVADGSIMYWSSSTPASEGTWPYRDAQRARSILLERIADWNILPQLVSEADPTTLVAREHRDRPPLEHWGSGRVTLLGDAAHPMTNMWGQGVATATEDAVMLARCLHTGADPIAALRRYELLRIPRTTEIVLASHSYGYRGSDPADFTAWLYRYDSATEAVPAF